MVANSRRSGLKIDTSGFGGIGKLTVWHHVAWKYFDEITFNIGQQAGTATVEPESRKVVKLGKYKIHKFIFSLSITGGLKIQIERQPTEKKVFIKK